VRDTGIGIGSAQLESVFELFQQGQGDLARTQGGLGLGLALARKLLTLHGGTVTAESAGTGRGSLFRVRLPTVQDLPVVSREPDEGTRYEDARAERRRVLVVDDHIDAAHGLSTLLGLLGHEVTTVHDGEQALQQDLQFHPDLIFLDIGMPDLDGFEVGRRIRARGGSQPVLVALTGFGQESARERIAKIGFDHHVLKPIDGPTLERILKSAVERPARPGD
jgi:CheY-like chemotaxis protein